MPQKLLPAESCLIRPYPSSQKGGTLIAEGIVDRKAHERLVCRPDGYRPARCQRCNHAKLHVHDYLERVIRGEGTDGGQTPVVVIVRYLCALCRATWRILPQFLARQLWRSWAVVEERVLIEKPPPHRPPIPPSTLRRWKARLLMTALVLTQSLATSGSATLEVVAKEVGLVATRAKLLAVYERSHPSQPGSRLANLAVLLHRLTP